MGRMRIENRFQLAVALDELAKDADPYGHADCCDGESLGRLGCTMDDLEAGKTAPYIEWLDGLGQELFEAVGEDTARLAQEARSALLAIDAGALA